MVIIISKIIVSGEYFLKGLGTTTITSKAFSPNVKLNYFFASGQSKGYFSIMFTSILHL
jgi:hypothetical protein